MVQLQLTGTQESISRTLQILFTISSARNLDRGGYATGSQTYSSKAFEPRE
jgi:hypothetical protein